MSTIYDVAEYAGVSKSTVSLVLNKSPLVKPATEERVLNAIRALNYVPNNNAQGLSSNKTNCIGIIIMEENQGISNYDFDNHVGLCSYNISTGVMSTLMHTKYGSLIEKFCARDNPGELPFLIKNRRVDGAVITGSPYDNAMIEKLKAIDFPFVLAGVDSAYDGIDCVSADPAEGVVLGLRYLAEKGHKNIFFLNCPITFHSSYVREKAFYATASELGIAVNPKWIVNCKSNNGLSAYEMMGAVLENGIRPDAILAANGQLAIGAIRKLTEKGLKVPQDVSVFGYEDSSLSGYCIPPLTTVNIHKEQIGSTAAQRLVEVLEKNENNHCVQIVHGDIVIRDSVIDRN